MGIFGFFQKKGNLLSITNNMISELRNILAMEQSFTKTEWGKVQRMLEHVIAVEEKIREHEGLLNSMNPKDRRRLDVLQAEFGDLEELRKAIQLLNDEISRLTELQANLAKQEKDIALQGTRQIEDEEKKRLESEIPESEEVQRILDIMRKHKKDK